MANMEIEKLKIGNEAKWGIATIANILLDSHLQLATDFEPKIGIETLINIEKSFYEDKENMECSFDDFKYFAGEIILASKKVFDNIANDKINEVLKVHEEKLKAVQLEKKVEGMPSILPHLLNISGYYLNSQKKKRFSSSLITTSEKMEIVF